MPSLGQWSFQCHLCLSVTPSRSCHMELHGCPRPLDGCLPCPVSGGAGGAGPEAAQRMPTPPAAQVSLWS